MDAPERTLDQCCNASSRLNDLCRFADALACADQALRRHPGHVASLMNRALALDGLGRTDAALEAGWQAILLEPGDALARYHQAERLLREGELSPAAWSLYEARLMLNGHTANSPLRLWQGEDLHGRTILLHAEQGLGDTLQFVRYAPLVAARGGTVVLAVQPPLQALLHATPGVDVIVPAGGCPPRFDVVCPLLSLPGIFGTTLGQVPPPLPYAHRFEPWADTASGLRVGLVWAGRPGFVHDQHRSVPPQSLASLARIPGVQFYSLQHGGGGAMALPGELRTINLMGRVSDFTQTASLIAGLDLVISVDTAVAHLAATMGKPVWLLSRFLGCWRWLQRRDDNPWYPSLRLYRQPEPGDWASVLRRVRRDLTQLR